MTGRWLTHAGARTRWLRTALVLVAAGCGGPQKLGGTGATCFRDDDCSAGLICVAPTADDIHRVCSNDPTPLISMVMGPDYGGMAMGGGAGAGAGSGGGATAGAAGTAAGGTASGGAAGGTASGGSAGKASTGGKGGSAGMASGGTETAGSGGTGGAGTGGSGGTDATAGAP